MQKLLILILMMAVLPLECSALGVNRFDRKASTSAFADSIIVDAENAYDLGNFGTVIRKLDGRISDSWTYDQKVKAYRLLSLSSIYLDDNVGAKKYATRLLDADPYYTAYDDSPNFQDLLQSLKVSETKITTASSQSEGVEESPVPITVITRDMIDYSGAQTLQDVLCLYVPGMAKVGGNETNISMRSVYGNMQEEILIMLDGHRMNSGATNAEAPDFRHSLDKVDHIEVLRGPASSLYGNVAMTAVVNVITKSGSKVKGLQLNGLAGMHYQFGGGFMYGNGNRQSDILAWGNVYNSRGEKYKVEQLSERYLGGYNHKPAFDFGVKAHWKDFTVSVNGQHCKQVPFINLVSSGTEFDYDKYEPDNGNKAGTSRTTINANVDYSHRWRNFTVSATGYFNTERTEIYNVLGDTVSQDISRMMLYVLTGQWELNPPTRGLWETLSWEDYTFGTNVNGSYDYKLGSGGFHHGTILAGIQFDYFMLTSNKFNLGNDYSRINQSNNFGLTTNNEWSLSPYLQIKHYIGRHFIFNGGLRYDHKARFSGSPIRTVSPRATLIWLPSKQLSLKFGYSRSFVDAPYLYRASNVSFLSGGNLQPQYINSLQLGSMYKLKKWTFEANVFFNMARDLVRFNSIVFEKWIHGESESITTFANSGKLDVAGLEIVTEYNSEGRLYGNFNMTIQHPTSMTGTNVVEDDCNLVDNESLMQMNATCAGRFWGNSRIGSFWLRGNVHFQTANELVTLSMDNILVGERIISTIHQNANAQLNLGLDWKWKDRLKVSMDVYNVTNSRIGLGTMMCNPTPSQGTRFVGRVQVNI